MSAMRVVELTRGKAAARERAWLWWIVLAGVVCRLAGARALARHFSFPDSADYDTLARAMALGQDYLAHGLLASRMPGYPAFVSNFYLIFGMKLWPVLVGQGLMSGLTGFLVYDLGKQISPRVGRVAAGLFAVDPLTIGFAATLLSETLFTTLLLLMVWLALRVARGGRIENWLALGVIAAAGTYVRGEAYGLILPLGGVMVIGAFLVQTGRQRWGALAAGLIGFAAAGLILVALVHPWRARNAGLFPEAPMRLTSLEGISLYESVYPGATGGPMQDKIKLPEEMVGMNEAQENAEWERRAWKEVWGDPVRMLRLAVVKVGRTWSPWMNAAEANNLVLQVGLSVWHVGLFLLGVVGLVVGFGRGCAGGASRPAGHGTLLVVLLVPVFYFTAVHALYIGSVRYRVPVMPLVHVFAAMGLSWVWDLRHGRIGSQREAFERV